MLDQARGIQGVRSVVLDIELGNGASVRVAERVGATRREPTRIEHDRHGIARTLAVYLLTLSGRVSRDSPGPRSYGSGRRRGVC